MIYFKQEGEIMEGELKELETVASIPKPGEIFSTLAILKNFGPAVDYFNNPYNKEKPVNEAVDGLFKEISNPSGGEELSRPAKRFKEILEKYGEGNIKEILIRVLDLDRPVEEGKQPTGKDLGERIASRLDFRYQEKIAPKIERIIEEIWQREEIL